MPFVIGYNPNRNTCACKRIWRCYDCNMCIQHCQCEENAAEKNAGQQLEL